MTYHILYNPFAGNGKTDEAIAALSQRLSGDLITHDITQIEGYTAFFSGIRKEDVIIVCGGDGTLNRFVNDTVDIPLPCDVLYYAHGSGNDFLRDLEKDPSGDPINIKEYIQDLPTVTVNGTPYHFLNNIGFGIDGYCCEVGDAQKKASTKAVNYTAIAIKGLLFYYKPTAATVTVDGKEYRYKNVWLAPTMKGRYYGGGMMAAPKQDRSAPDGKLSTMVFHGRSRIKTLIVFPSVFKGEHVKHTKMVTIHEGYDIHVKFDRPAPVQIDGETILGVTEYHATARKPAIV